MIRTLLYLTVFIFLLACKKEEVVANGVPDSNFELSSILRLNGKKCSFDAEASLLKYSILSTELTSFSPHVVFQENAIAFFEGTQLDNDAVNLLGDLQLHTLYSCKVVLNGVETNFKLVFTSIPIIQIAIKDEVVNGYKTLAKMTVNYPNNGVVQNWIGVEFRGSSSQRYTKKS